jgi:ketosteroid isomerase-like protein
MTGDATTPPHLTSAPQSAGLRRSNEGLDVTGQMSRQCVLQHLKASYGGEIERALEYYANDVDFICYAPVELFPSLGHKHGKAAIRTLLKRWHRRYCRVDYDVDFIAAEDERVAVIVKSRMVVRETGRVITADIANFFVLRDGKIHRHRQFVDSFDLVEQLLRRDLVIALHTS